MQVSWNRSSSSNRDSKARNRFNFLKERLGSDKSLAI
jgi:hypothetical protein